MSSLSRPLTYQKILLSKFFDLSLAIVIGFASGLLAAGYVWAKSGYEFVPSEIVVQPPPSNATWCFPDTGLSGAETFSEELHKQMLVAHTSQYSSATLSRSLENTRRKSAGASVYSLQLLAVTPQHFTVVAVPNADSNPSDFTLITERGYYYLHAIPKRRHEKYDSLASARLRSCLS